MAAIAISHDQDAIRGDLHISAPAERVFPALTDPRELMQWWGEKGMYRPTNFVLGWMQAFIEKGETVATHAAVSPTLRSE